MRKEKVSTIKNRDRKEMLSTLSELESQGYEINRPLKRCDCPSIRPCPFVSCQYNMYLDVDSKGTILYNVPDKEPWEVDHGKSCLLDMCKDIHEDMFNKDSSRGLSYEEISNLLGGVSRETIRLIDISARNKIRVLFELDMQEDADTAQQITISGTVPKEEFMDDFSISSKVFDRWVEKGLAYSIIHDNIYIDIEAVVEFFNMNYSTYYIHKIESTVHDKYFLEYVSSPSE